jgi:hypothetical protein
MAEMVDQPVGWYWAAFPGTWVFYRPDCGVLSTTAGDLLWHNLGSRLYFGPWYPPARPLATKSPVALFEYHTLYTLAQIETIAGQSATRSPGISHLPNQASVLGPESEQYDFCGDDDEHLVLLWIDDHRNL